MAGVAQLKAMVGMDNSKYKAGAKGVKSANTGLSASFKSVATGLAAAFSIRAVANYAKSVIDLGSKLSDLATQTGMNVETLQAFEYSAIKAGASVEDVRTAVNKLSVNLGKAKDGQKTYIDLFMRAGIAQEDIANLNTEDTLAAIAKTMSTASAGTKEWGAALELIGTRSGAKLIEVLQDLNSKGLPEFVKQAKEAGIVMDAELIQKLDEAADKMLILQRIGKGKFAQGLFRIGDHIEAFKRSMKTGKSIVESHYDILDEREDRKQGQLDKKGFADARANKARAIATAAANELATKKKITEEAAKEAKLVNEADLKHLAILEKEDELEKKISEDREKIIQEGAMRSRKAGEGISALDPALSGMAQLGASFGNEKMGMQQYDRDLQLRQRQVEIAEETNSKLDTLAEKLDVLAGDI
jgi:hypothetical protein